MAHGLVSSNQRTPRRDVIMADQKPPVLAYYGVGPFNFTISHNSVNTNSITSVLGSNDGKTCTLYNNASALFLRTKIAKPHSIPNPYLGCARDRAKSLTTALKRPDLARPVNYRAHLVTLSLAEKYISSRTMAHTKPYFLPNIESNKPSTGPVQ